MPTQLVYWWNKYNKTWVIQVLDENQNEIDYSVQGNKISRDYEINSLVQQYNISKIKKIKGVN